MLEREATMLNRRAFLFGSLAVLAGPISGAAQPAGRTPRVGYLFSFTPSAGREYWEACRQGLRELGYQEGRTIHLGPRWADGHHDRLPALVGDLLRVGVDVIVAAATPASRAAHAATKKIPIVIVAVADPVRAGLVATLARPGGNVTGLTLLTPELSGKRVELLAEILTGALPRLAVLTNPANLSHLVFLEETREATRRTGTEVHVLEARVAEEIESAFDAAVSGRATAMIVFDDPVLWSARREIVGLAAKRRLPVMYGYREFVDDGGLISYNPSRPDLYRRTASYVDKILRGAQPADLPIERPTKFELVVNLRTARAADIAIPPSLQLRADQVIE
jgi:putative ABC transport system substrate-binding protein